MDDADTLQQLQSHELLTNQNEEQNISPSAQKREEVRGSVNKNKNKSSS